MNELGADPSHRNREKWITWGILVGGALVLRGVFANARLVLTGDELHYAESLHHFMAGNVLKGISEYWSNMYPLFAVPFGLLSGGAESGLRILSVLAGSALVIPCIIMARNLWGEREAVFAGVLVAMHPSLIVFSTSAFTESFYSLLLLLSLLFLVTYMRGGKRLYLVLLGVFLGLSYQTRQEAQFILALTLLVLLFGIGGRGLKAPLKVRFQRAAVIIVLFVLIVLPHALLLHQKTGRWTMGSKASVNLSSSHIWEEGPKRERYVYSLNDEGTARRIDEVSRESAVRILWRRRSAIASDYFTKLSRGVAVVPMLFATPFLLLLVPLGLFGRAWKRTDLGVELLMLLVGIFPFLLYSVFRVEVRYLIPFLPLYLLWGGRGCGVLCDWLRENVSTRPVLRMAALLLIFVSLVPYTVHRYGTVLKAQPVEYREIGEWIKENLGSGKKILAQSGCSVSYYAGNPEATFIPYAGTEGLLRYARYHRYDYLVADEDYIRERRPMLSGILDGESSDLTRVKTFTGRNGHRIDLFRIIR